MTIIVEHSGTKEHLLLVDELRYLLEVELGHNVEEVVKNLEKSIALYNQNMEVIAVFTKVPTIEELKFYINIYGED